MAVREGKRLTADCSRFAASAFAFLVLLCIAAPAAAEEMGELRVSDGDTLSELALQHLDRVFRWREVARINRLQNPDLIFPGQKLLVPARFFKGVPVEGVVTFLKGDVQVRSGRDGEWKPLVDGDKVKQGSSIRTGEGSTEVAFADNTRVLLRPGSEVEIRQAEQKTDTSFIRRFFLGLGRVLTELKKATGAASRYEITTPSATATARGTDFRVSVDEAGTTRSEVLEGAVEVAAQRKAVTLSEGQGTVVVKGGRPGDPERLLPPPTPRDALVLYKTLPLRFSFSEVGGAQSYRVSVTRDEAGKDVVAERSIRPGELFVVHSVEDGEYFLAGQSVDTRGLEGGGFTPLRFKVRTNPAPPIIQAPKGGAELRGKEVEIRWLKVGGAVRYRLQVSKDTGFKSFVTEKADLEETAHRVGGLEPGRYYFRVCSVADDGFESEWSDPLYFDIVALPAAPGLGEAKVGDEKIHLSWKDMGPGMSYHFQMARDETFGATLVDAKTAKPGTELDRPSESGVYLVRVSTIDSAGYEGDFSAPQSFEVPSRFPYAAVGAVAAVIGILLLVVP